MVNGSYCRDRVMEFLCNYFYPQCDNYTNIVPICEISCDKHLATGICANHLHNILTILDGKNHLNVSVDRLVQNSCSPPYNATVSDDCHLLTSEYIYSYTHNNTQEKVSISHLLCIYM